MCQNCPPRLAAGVVPAVVPAEVLPSAVVERVDLEAAGSEERGKSRASEKNGWR